MTSVTTDQQAALTAALDEWFLLHNQLPDHPKVRERIATLKLKDLEHLFAGIEAHAKEILQYEIAEPKVIALDKKGMMDLVDPDERPTWDQYRAGLRAVACSIVEFRSELESSKSLDCENVEL